MSPRFYVTALPSRWRGYAVKRAIVVSDPQDSRRITTVYPTISRHFTWKAAQRRAHALNAEAGIAQ